MANNFKYNDLIINAGDLIRVHYRLIETEKGASRTKKGEKVEQKERIQIFEGIVLAINNKAENQTFTVRRIGVGRIGIERIFPINSPWIIKIELKKKGDARRAKLYYMRG